MRRVVLIASCLLLAACGQDKEEENAARRTVERFNAALVDKDGRSVCRQLSRAGRRELERAAQRRQDCATLFDFALTFSRASTRPPART